MSNNTPVTVAVSQPPVPVIPPKVVTITLGEADAQILRLMLGGLKLKTRGGAVRKNGGTAEQRDRAKVLTKEIFTALDAQGFKANPRSGSVGVAAPEYDADDETDYEYDVDAE